MDTTAHSSDKQAPRVRTEPAPLLARMVERNLLSVKHRVLCYGCGAGVDVGWLKVRKYRAQGYDTQPVFGYTTLPEGKFDYVFLIYLLRRLKSDEMRQNVIQRAFDYVRPGGALVISSRQWQRYAHECGLDYSYGPREYFERLASTVNPVGIEFPQFDTDDGAACVFLRQGGIYTPRNPVHWVESPDEFRAVCERLHAQPRVGLDVETTLDEPRTLCTVQLATPQETFVIDALAQPDLAPLQALMENESVEKVIHNAMFEEQMLGIHRIKIRNIYDTLIFSRKKTPRPADGGHKLGEVCEREMGIYMDKSLQTSDWTTRPLSKEQLAYAAVDAEVLLDLHRVFCPPPEPVTLDLF